VFVAAALDMCFHVFDKSLIQLQTLQHNTRAVLMLLYNPTPDEIICTSASGLLSWKLSRTFVGTERQFQLQQLRVFDASPFWAPKARAMCNVLWKADRTLHAQIEIDVKSQQVFALGGVSVYVYHAQTGKVLTILEKIHEAAVSHAVWYDRSQLYVTGELQPTLHTLIYLLPWTGDTRGLVKLWTSHHTGSNARHALLHTFHCHSRPITGLALHPIAGLIVR
jgi:hypothetical protein